MATTHGIRTWKRLSSNPSLPLEERIQETTHLSDMETAIREAHFTTIPKAVYNSSGQRIQQGYDAAYASALALILQEQYGYAGQVRTSRSGSSYVFERLAATQGGSFDFGVAPSASTPPVASNGALSA